MVRTVRLLRRSMLRSLSLNPSMNLSLSVSLSLSLRRRRRRCLPRTVCAKTPRSLLRWPSVTCSNTLLRSWSNSHLLHLRRLPTCLHVHWRGMCSSTRPSRPTPRTAMSLSSLMLYRFLLITVRMRLNA